MAIETAPSPQRTPQGERTVERVLDAAEGLFSQSGLEATSLREVARAAGLRAPSLYNHFPDKEALYEAVLERALRPMLEVIEAFLAAGDAAYREPRIVEDMMALLARRPAIARLLHHETLAGGEHMNAVLRSWLASLYGGGLETLKRSPFRGAWKDEELPRLLFAMATLFTGYFSLAPGVAAAFGGDPFSEQALREQTQFMRKLWEGVWRAPA